MYYPPTLRALRYIFLAHRHGGSVGKITIAIKMYPEFYQIADHTIKRTTLLLQAGDEARAVELMISKTSPRDYNVPDLLESQRIADEIKANIDDYILSDIEIS